MASPPPHINVFIFPEFKEAEKKKAPHLTLTPYAQLAIKILKRLELQDVCCAEQVCKEWKQLLSNSNIYQKLFQRRFKDIRIASKQPILARFIARKNEIFNRSSILASLPSSIYQHIFFSFDSLVQDELRKILDARSCARMFNQHMPSNIKLLQEYYPQKLKPYFRKILTYLNKNAPYSYQNNNLLSMERIEEAYALALKHAALKKDCIQQSLYVEKLGDIYLEKSKATTLPQAAGLYNYALRLSSKNRQEIIKEKLSNIQQSLLTELCGGEPLNLEQMQKQFEDNRKLLKNFRKGIKEKIYTLPETPSSEQVRELYREIAQEVKVFFKGLVDQANDVLGPPPCEYAMIGFGSLAREEMTPYSDLEFGILISDDNTKNRKYFKNLTTLIHLKVINLGETILRALNIPYLKEIDFFDSITPRGFAFDGAGVEGKGCKTPLGNGMTFELIQTPEKMAQYIGKDGKGNWWHEKEPHLPMELLTFTHLLGNPELTIEYARKVQLNLNMPYQEDLNLRQYFAKVHLAKKDMISFDPGMQDLERHGMLFKIKNDFYRFPHLALDRLALLNKIEASDTFTRIDELNKQGILTQTASEKLKDWMNIALFMRLKTYSHYQAQKEMMNPLLKPFGLNEPELIKQQFALDQETLEKVKKIYHVFIPFYLAFKEFLAGNEDTLKLSDLEDNSPQTHGDIAARLFQNEEAKVFYLQALQVDPQNAGVLNALGVIYQNQGDFEQAVEYANQALDIDLKHSDKNCAAVARDYTTLGFIYYKQEDFEKAIMYVSLALDIGIDLFGENHPLIATRYNTLGTLYKERGKLEQAIQQAKKAFAINQGLCTDEKSPALARDYNILGMIYHDQSQEDLEKATEYIKKALEIDIKLFGKKHPNVAIRWRNLGMIYQKKGKLNLAIKYTKKALKIDRKFYHKNHPKLAINYNNLGTQYYQERKLDLAAKHTKKALKINLRFFRKNHSCIVEGFIKLGVIHHSLENFKQKDKCFELARRNELKLI